jgi:hypothetical protein
LDDAGGGGGGGEVTTSGPSPVEVGWGAAVVVAGRVVGRCGAEVWDAVRMMAGGASRGGGTMTGMADP